MSLQTSHATLWVRDQDEALAFFEKLGFDVREDVKNGEYRRLSVASPNQPGLALVLAKPCNPMDGTTSTFHTEAVDKGVVRALVFAPRGYVTTQG